MFSLSRARWARAVSQAEAEPLTWSALAIEAVGGRSDQAALQRWISSSRQSVFAGTSRNKTVF